MTLEQAWWEHLATVRWFGGKGAEGGISALTPVAEYTPAGSTPQVGSEVATIDYDDGRREFYHLLVARYPAGTAPVEPVGRDGASDVVDATSDPAAVRAFVQAVQQHPGDSMTWLFSVSDVRDRDVNVWPGEQSNTTIVLGEGALFKLFRRIEPGANLDAEVLQALASSPAATPKIYGRLRAAWPSAGDTTDLGMVIERVAGAKDGWELASTACAAGTDFTEDARALGKALKAVHEQLRIVFGTASMSGSAIASTMESRLADAVTAAPVLAPHKAALVSGFDLLRGRELDVQRVHGDFHLGQTLRSPSGWTIIDFEGEPAKTAEERRALDSVWRDVAGMLRSFDYARSAHQQPDSTEARNWATASQNAFTEGYGGALAPERDVLSAYVIDKAVYEVVYETRNRPDWVGIPLRAIEALSATGGVGETNEENG